MTNFCSSATGSVAVTTARSFLCSMSVELSKSRISALVMAEGRLFSAARPIATMVFSASEETVAAMDAGRLAEEIVPRSGPRRHF